MDRKRGHLTNRPEEVTKNLKWVKVVGIGHKESGKTCLIKHFCESKFANGYQPTVGVDYGFKIQEVEGVTLRVHLWDLSGSSEYLDVRNELYDKTDAVFLVYDVTRPGSFDSLEIWLKEVIKYGPSPSPEICLVANKIDQKAARMVPVAEGKQWATSHKMRYFETSCATGEGVSKLFEELLSAVVQKKDIKVPS